LRSKEFLMQAKQSILVIFNDLLNKQNNCCKTQLAPRFMIGKGNNHYLVKMMLNQRNINWQKTNSEEDAAFIWT